MTAVISAFDILFQKAHTSTSFFLSFHILFTDIPLLCLACLLSLFLIPPCALLILYLRLERQENGQDIVVSSYRYDFICILQTWNCHSMRGKQQKSSWSYFVLKIRMLILLYAVEERKIFTSTTSVNFSQHNTRHGFTLWWVDYFVTHNVS